MKISDLLATLKRPVDYIRINAGEHKTYLYSGYEDEGEHPVPLQIQALEVITWEVSVTMEMQSMCEVNIIFTLDIETTPDITQ